MNKLLVIIIFGVFITPLGVNAQNKRVEIAKAFIHDLLLTKDSFPTGLLKYMSFGDQKNAKVDTLFFSLIYEYKRDFDTLLLGDNVNNYQVMPYDELDIKIRRPFPKRKGRNEFKNVYGIVFGDSIISYFLFKGNKIKSLFYISKGRGDYNYFLII